MMAYLSRKLRSVDASAAKKGRVRSTRSVPLLPPRPAAKREIPEQLVNNGTIGYNAPQPYLDPIVTKASQRPLSQVTAPGSPPEPESRPRPPIPPPKLLADSKATRLARSQSEIRPRSYDRGPVERQRSERKKKELAYLIVDLSAGSASDPSSRIFTIRETSQEIPLRQRIMSVPTRPVVVPRIKRASSLSRPSSDASTSSSCSSHQEDMPTSWGTSPKRTPPPRHKALQSPSLTTASPAREDESQLSPPSDDMPPVPPRRNRAPRTPPSPRHSSAAQVSAHVTGQSPGGKPKPVRPPPPSVAALQKAKTNRTKSLLVNRSPPTVARSLPARLTSQRSMTLCPEHSAIRPDYEEIDQSGEEPVNPSSCPPPKLPERNRPRGNVLPLPPKSHSKKAKPLSVRTISNPISGTFVSNGSPLSSRSASVPNESTVVEEEDEGGGVYEPVNPIDYLPLPVQPPLPTRSLSKNKSRYSTPNIVGNRGRSTSLSPMKSHMVRTPPKSDPLQRRRPPPPPLASSLTTAVSRDRRPAKVTENSRKKLDFTETRPNERTSTTALDKPQAIYEEIDQDQGQDQDQGLSHDTTERHVSGPNVLPLPPKRPSVTRGRRPRSQSAAPHLGEPVQLPVGEYVLATHPEGRCQDTESEGEPDIGGMEEYVEMNSLNGWERELAQGEGPGWGGGVPEETTAVEGECDEGGELYVEMHPVMSMCEDQPVTLDVGEEGGVANEEEEEEDVGGEEIYIEMNNPDDPPSLYYASTDIVGQRPDLQAEFLRARGRTSTAN